jgi:hypothetical protein
MLYTCGAIKKLAQRYYEKGGEVTEIEPGSLGYGLTLMHGEGLKTAVVKEVYINEWSSGHKVRLYNKMPEKYRKMINEREVTYGL